MSPGQASHWLKYRAILSWREWRTLSPLVCWLSVPDTPPRCVFMLNMMMVPQRRIRVRHYKVGQVSIKNSELWLVWILSGVGLLFVLLGIAAIYWVFSYRNKKRKENKKGKPKPGQPDGKPPPPPAKMTSKTSSKDTVNTENIADTTNSTESTKIADTTITSEAKDEITQSSGLQTLSSHKSGVSSSSDVEKLHFGKMGMMNLRFLLEADTLKSHSGLFQRSPKNDGQYG